jgi:hypothetical protein
MSFGLSGAALAGIAVGGATLVSGLAQADAASSAAAAQSAASQAGIEEQRRQFDKVQELLKPYVEAGTSALGGFGPYQQAGAGAIPILQQYAAAGAPALQQQQAIAGLLGPEAQRQAIASIEQGAGFQAQVRQGEEALLQRASATGGLRGGNIQAALAQFRPQMLQQAIEQQYGRLGGLAGVGGTIAQQLANAGMGATETLSRLGQASAAGTGAAAQTSGSNIANLLQQQGAAQAGADIAQGRAFGAIPSAIAGGLGIFSGLGGKF